MHLPFIKALWEEEISLSKLPASLMASVFVISFANECTRLIGLKSLGCSATSSYLDYVGSIEMHKWPSPVMIEAVHGR